MTAIRSLAHDPFAPTEPPALVSSRRQDGWSAISQRQFLEAIAEGLSVERAAMRVGLSPSAAYAFRRSARGAAFALGWRAASMIAREVVAETLMARALDGQEETITRDDGSTVTRRRYDNHLAIRLLNRLDRQAETLPDADCRAARIVALEFDAFLDVVERDEAPACAGLFLARRGEGLAAGEGQVPDLAPVYALAAADRLVRTGVATAAEVATDDLDVTQRAGWTAEQWARAEAAGLVALAPPQGDESDLPAIECEESQHSHTDDEQEDEIDGLVYRDRVTGEWRTLYPPPPYFDGREWGRFGELFYRRTLAPHELDLVEAQVGRLDPETLAERFAQYDDWMAAMRDREQRWATMRSG
ncbi:hypothetical protein GGQ80_001549 [Sphingomonas jinjuensis]|uniref:Uncharacterized protein n=1 Tax=Sphingomonas jinjuensis TaxID=535907 RepID=A0A840F2R9_9SPHN|nr:hypothetical protein [Sphingomonas jinjuensis]MBB4153643.1 hypothetical protein [Sphingomonas jinjuensis]